MRWWQAAPQPDTASTRLEIPACLQDTRHWGSWHIHASTTVWHRNNICQAWLPPELSVLLGWGPVLVGVYHLTTFPLFAVWFSIHLSVITTGKQTWLGAPGWGSLALQPCESVIWVSCQTDRTPIRTAYPSKAEVTSYQLQWKPTTRISDAIEK